MTEFMDDVAVRRSEGLCLTVKARPAASHARSIKLVEIGDGKRAIEIAVTATPQEGRANKALIGQLAVLFGVKKGEVTLKTGPKSRVKSFLIAGNAEELIQRLRASLQETK